MPIVFTVYICDKHDVLQSIEEGNRKDWYRQMYRSLHKVNKNGRYYSLHIRMMHKLLH